MRNTSLCRACSLARTNIVCCIQHGFVQYNGMAPTKPMVAIRALHAVEPGTFDRHQEHKRWCSLCFSLASFQCATLQNDEFQGCGMRLCGPCYRCWHLEFHCDMDAMIAAYDARPKVRDTIWDPSEVVIRADVGLLAKNSLLAKNFRRYKELGS